MEDRILISIVTFNSGKYIETCLRGLKEQTFKNYLVSIIDNHSDDNTTHLVKNLKSKIRLSLIENDINIGFAAAHNINIYYGIRDYSPPFILVLNPDVYLLPDYIEKICRVFDKEQRLGSATGKLIRASIGDFRRFDFETPQHIDDRVIDSTGLYFNPALRHWDRGIGEKDIGQFEREEYIFGVSGAAAFYRTDMLEDIKVGGEYYDEGFFAYREDADLSWRAQIYGWKAAYVPSAVGFHVRHVLPMGRKQYPHFINMHSVKNRFLMRIKNMDFLTFIKCFPFLIIRDIQVILYVVFIERSSLTGFIYILKNIKTYLSRRRVIFKNRRVSLKYITKWFSFSGKSYPIKAEFNWTSK